MCLIYTILSLRSWVPWDVFRSTLNTSTSYNFESRACWNFKEESVFGVAARAGNPENQPVWESVSWKRGRWGSVGHVSTFGLARPVPGACHLGASRAEQVGRRAKPAGFCVGQIELTPYWKEAAIPQFQPLPSRKNTPCGARSFSFRRNQKCGFSCDIWFLKLAEIFQQHIGQTKHVSGPQSSGLCLHVWTSALFHQHFESLGG